MAGCRRRIALAQGVKQRHVRILDPDPDPLAVHAKGVLAICSELKIHALEARAWEKEAAYFRCVFVATPSIARSRL
jgi:hypothetical protein